MNEWHAKEFKIGAIVADLSIVDMSSFPLTLHLLIPATSALVKSPNKKNHHQMASL